MTLKMNESYRHTSKELRALAYQYTTLMLKGPLLLKRVPYHNLQGRHRVLIHLVKIFLGTIRYGMRQKVLVNVITLKLALPPLLTNY